MDEENRPGGGSPRTEDAPDGPPPAPDSSGEAGEAEAPRPILPGNVGSLDDVPADAGGVPVIDEEG